jgi:PBP1b-binding outer membrane lipoprotein LpoB
MKKMKKIIAVVALSIFLFASCGGAKKPDAVKTDSTKVVKVDINKGVTGSTGSIDTTKKEVKKSEVKK